IAHGSNKLSCLVNGFHHRNHNVGGAEIQISLDRDGITRRRAHRNRATVCLRSLQLREDAVQIVGSMLSINKQPVEASASAYFGHECAARACPHADLHSSAGEPIFEFFCRSHTNLTASTPSGP